MSVTQRVWSFWFKDWNKLPPLADHISMAWFRKNDAFDQEIKNNFESDVHAALKGAYDGLTSTPEGALAVTILLDQFPRNMYRNSPQAFAFDSKAREVALKAIEQNFHLQMTPIESMFFILPLEHSEDINDQKKCVELSKELESKHAKDFPFLASVSLFAKDHLDVIERFGRFPFRNQVLGRESTPEEIEFMKSHKGY